MDPRVEKVLKLPNRQKVMLLAAILLFEGAGLVWGLYLPKQKEYTELQGKLTGLNAQVDENRKIANNLPKFKQDYENLKAELEKALTELPNQKEIPSLLTSITSLGKNAGLDFLLFRPKPEEAKEFYAAVPVDITVSGSYYNVANFFAAVANLPRIVNIANVNFSEIKESNGRTLTKVTCLATTFRFLDKKENQDEKKK